MEHNHPINEINARADALGISVRQLCEEAGVNPSTYWRWQQPQANPRLRDMEAALGAIMRVLAIHERAVLATLIERYPDDARAAIGKEPGVAVVEREVGKDQ